MTKNVKIVVSVKDKASSIFSKMGKSSKKMGATIKKNLNKIRLGAGIASAGIVAMGKNFVKAANNQIEQEKKLEVVLKKRTNATDEQIDAIKRLASEQQKLGIIGDEIQLAGAQQLATFVKSTKSVENLLPAMNNLVAQQKGVNASQSDMINIANLMGKAMDGQVGALSRVGISFSDAQAEILKTGNEMERSAILAEVITANVGNMNEALAKTTFAGQMKQLSNMLGDVGETIGMALIPMIQDLLEKIQPIINTVVAWIEKNPELTAKIMVVVGAITALIAVVAILGPAIAILAGPIGIVIAAIALLTTGFIKLFANFPTYQAQMGSLEGQLLSLDEQFKAGTITEEQYREGLNRIEGEMAILEAKSKTFWGSMRNDLAMMVDNIKNTPQFLGDTFNAIGGFFDNMVARIGEGFIRLGKNLAQSFMDKIQGVLDFVQKARDKLSSFLGKSTSKSVNVGGALTASLPGRAKGGPVDKNSPYMVGEEGPELFVPGKSGGITNNDDLKGLLSSAETMGAEQGQRIKGALNQLTPTKQLVLLREMGITFEGGGGGQNVLSDLKSALGKGPAQNAKVGEEQNIVPAPAQQKMSMEKSVEISINMGGITINNQLDEDNVVARLIGKIKDSLKRDTQLYNLGIN